MNFELMQFNWLVAVKPWQWMAARLFGCVVFLTSTSSACLSVEQQICCITSKIIPWLLSLMLETSFTGTSFVGEKREGLAVDFSTACLQSIVLIIFVIDINITVIDNDTEVNLLQLNVLF